MSLILEALKKSEANRRLGQAPDLGTPFSPTRRERSPLWAVVVIVLALGAGLWWWFGSSSTPATVAPKPTQVAAIPAPANKTMPVRSVPAPATRPHSSEPVVQDTAAMGFGPFPPGSPQQTQNEDQRVFFAARRAEQAAALAQNEAARQHAPVRQTAPAAHAPAPPAPAMHVVTPPAPTVPTASVAAAAPSATAGTTPNSAIAPTPHPTASPQASPPGVAKSDVQSYYDLPFATRKALPQLRMSMHVYTADPKQRFVILDGARMVEGDSTPDNVALREIRPDGVILEFQGQRFFFPRDGH